MQNFETWI